MTAPHPTGRAVPPRTVELRRSFDATPEQVWASFTESDRLDRWYGHWEGDPASGSVMLTMVEAPDDPAPIVIDRCEPPHALHVTINGGGLTWHLQLRVEPDGDRSTLVFGQVFDGPEMVPDIGAGWEYYLDRLVAAETGGDVDAVDFERDYYPAMAEYYRDVASRLTFD